MTTNTHKIPRNSPILCLKVLILAHLLGACSTTSPPAPVISKPAATNVPVPVPVTANLRQDVDLPVYVARLKGMTPPQLQAEIILRRHHHREIPSYANRLRLALALWASGGDDQEIQGLAEPGTAGSEDAQLRGTGLLISSIVAERRRNREFQASSQSRNLEVRRTMETQQARLDTLQRQIDELERKLAALRDIEKSLIQRP
jgi:hypothetical protein